MIAPSHGLELLTTTEMTAADLCAVARGVPSLVLMENAGRAITDEATRMVPAGGRILILCGPGNNGGDGFVAGRLLRERGFQTRLVLLGDRAQLKGDAAEMAKRYPGDFTPAPDAIDLIHSWPHLVIDALFGAGLSRPLSGTPADLVEAVNAAGRPVLAVDVPSGLDGTTGNALGPVVQATRTVTFFRRKPGHLLLPGRLLCGDVALYDIAIPEAVLDSVNPTTSANAPAIWKHVLPQPSLDGHKYTRGHAVIVSGGIEMSGAARLAARGALRIGAGLVTVASPPDALVPHASQLNATLLKSASTPDELQHLLGDRRYTSVGIGPGLGRGEHAFAQVLSVLDSDTPVVVDADGLTVAAEDPDRLFSAIRARPCRPVVLTPHEGEFKRLFPSLSGSKLARAEAAADVSGAVVVLKGPDTVIAGPPRRAAINANAPPTLATAGSGDVLTGFITGLLAQGMPAFEAACAAVWMHGECANRIGHGLIAEDLPEALPAVLQTLRR